MENDDLGVENAENSKRRPREAGRSNNSNLNLVLDFLPQLFSHHFQAPVLQKPPIVGHRKLEVIFLEFGVSLSDRPSPRVLFSVSVSELF